MYAGQAFGCPFSTDFLYPWTGVDDVHYAKLTWYRDMQYLHFPVIMTPV
jgi:hypothetical protein